MSKVIFNTAGTGYWSNARRAVEITNIKLLWVTDEADFGEVGVFFNTDDWDVEQDGLIYTDAQFMRELKAFTQAHGLTDDISYSEQGMQGDDYVSCDVGKEFINAYKAKFPEQFEQLMEDCNG